MLGGSVLDAGDEFGDSLVFDYLEDGRFVLELPAAEKREALLFVAFGAKFRTFSAPVLAQPEGVGVGEGDAEPLGAAGAAGVVAGLQFVLEGVEGHQHVLIAAQVDVIRAAEAVVAGGVGAPAERTVVRPL